MADKDQEDAARTALASGVAYLRSRSANQASAGTTLQSSLAEALYALDSSVLDPVANLGEGTPQFAEAKGRVRKGQLQQVQDMKTLFFGGDGQSGLMKALREG